MEYAYNVTITEVSQVSYRDMHFGYTVLGNLLQIAILHLDFNCIKMLDWQLHHKDKA